MKVKTILLQHVKNDEPGILPEVLLMRNHSISCLYAGDIDDARIEECDLLIVLGGPMSVNQAAHYPFIFKEISILQKRIEHGLPTLGICLGAQMLAKAAGSKVYSQTKECGFAPLHFTEMGKKSCFRHLEETPVFHWHEETFDLPPNSQLLMSSAKCTNQAFSLGKKIMGTQFHLEADEKKIKFLGKGKTSWPPFTHDLTEKAKLCLHEWLNDLNL